MNYNRKRTPASTKRFMTRSPRFRIVVGSSNWPTRRSAIDAAPSQCFSWTSTTSRMSTTRSDIRQATGCSSRIAQRLYEVTRPHDCVARLGGDEFAIVLTDVDTASLALTEAQRLHDAVARPYQVSGVSVQVDTSIGVALSPQHGPRRRRPAPVRRYRDVRGEGSCDRAAASTDPMDDHHTPERLSLATELKAAIDSGSIALGYQPTKELTTDKVVGVEVLARWDHPTRGVLPPPTYIAVAEQTGLIQQLTQYVLRTALRQRQAWARRGIDLRLSVNVSVNDLESPDFVKETERLVRETNTPPGRLTLEITETQALQRPERIADVLQALRAHGIEIAIDDFGTGFSSLTSLRLLPLDEVKIDGSFIRDMTVNDHDDAIVRSMVELADDCISASLPRASKPRKPRRPCDGLDATSCRDTS